METETIITIVLAAFSSGFLSSVFVKLMDIHHENAVRKSEEKKNRLEKTEQAREDYFAEKKTVYIEALKRLAEIRTGFDYTRDGTLPEALRKRLEEINESSSDFSARMRLYSSDDVFNVYWNLARYSSFAYTYSTNTWRLGGESKEVFSLNVTFLARLMQADIGYRDYVMNPEKVKCPGCKREHDFYKTCKCGMTWDKTMEEIQKPLKEELEKKLKELAEQEIAEETRDVSYN